MTREEVIKILEEGEVSRESGFFEAYQMAIESLKQPEVIRCKDCKHWKHSTIRPNYCDVWDWCNRANDFCSFAERGEE